MWTQNFQTYNLCFKKAEEPEIKLPTITGSWRNQGNSRKICTSASFTMPKPLIVWITTNGRNFLMRWSTRPPYLSPEKLHAGQEQQSELDMKQLTGSKLGKSMTREYYCYPTYLMYMQSTSWETEGWKNNKLDCVCVCVCVTFTQEFTQTRILVTILMLTVNSM